MYQLIALHARVTVVGGVPVSREVTRTKIGECGVDELLQWMRDDVMPRGSDVPVASAGREEREQRA